MSLRHRERQVMANHIHFDLIDITPLMVIVLSGFGVGFPALKKTQRVVKGGDEVGPEVIK